MVDRTLTGPSTVAPAGTPPARRRPTPPWWAAAIAVFAASRVLSTLLFVWVGSQATVHSRAGAHPGLLQLLDAWDGQWYWWVAVNGYPSVLPHTAAGAIDTNAWAFLPLYPLVVKALALGSTALWPQVAVAVSTVCGALSAVLLALLLRPRIGSGAATFAVALYCVSPLAFVLQMAYAESAGLALLLAALVLVDRGRYGAAIAPALLLAFTRPGVLPLGLGTAALLVVRAVRTRRGTDDLDRAAALRGGALVLACVLGGIAWPVIAAVVTGVPGAYLSTEAAWRAGWVGDRPIAWFGGWFDAAAFWTSTWFGAGTPSLLAPTAVVLLVAGLAALLLLRPARRLGATVRLWCASYALWLLAVFFPQSSVFRLLMPLAPLTGALVPRTVPARAALLAAAAAGQALWLWVVLGPLQEYWTVL